MQRLSTVAIGRQRCLWYRASTDWRGVLWSRSCKTSLKKSALCTGFAQDRGLLGESHCFHRQDAGCFGHVPVLPKETISFLQRGSPPSGSALYVDGTVGLGGHASELLESDSTCRLICIDRDKEALATAKMRLAPFGERVHFIRGSYAELDAHLQQSGLGSPDGILLDLGLNSHQLDTSSRGFSFRHSGPLDMRFDRTKGPKAGFLLNNCGERELVKIFREYGEEPKARQVAQAVLRWREGSPFLSTEDFRNCIMTVEGSRGTSTSMVTRCFQALRIAVNEELEHVKIGLDVAVKSLALNGVIVVLSFHSLEDRLAKQSLSKLSLLTKKPVRASAAEVRYNPRARSVRLRAARKESIIQ